MKKCVDCVNLKTPFPRGRIHITCEELGETESGDECPSFKPRYDTPHFSFDYENVFMAAVTDVFQINKAAAITASSVEAQLAQQGLGIEYDPSFFLSAVKKVTDMWVIHKVLLGTGLAMYEDEIMSHVISDKFGRRDLPATHSPNFVPSPLRPSLAVDTPADLKHDLTKVQSHMESAFRTVVPSERSAQENNSFYPKGREPKS